VGVAGWFDEDKTESLFLAIASLAIKDFILGFAGSVAGLTTTCCGVG
jgi:hypothetical protein